MAELPRILLHLALWSAVVEALTLRVVLRLGSVMPDQETLLPLYRLFETVGVAALNLGMLAAAGLLVVAAIRRSWRHVDSVLVATILLGAAGVNLGFGTLFAAAPTSLGLLVQTVATMAAVVAIAGGAWRQRCGVVIVLVALAQLLALSSGLVDGLSGLGLDLSLGALPASAAELVAVAVALILPLGLPPRPRRRDVAVAFALGFVLVLLLAMRPWTIATMAMWTVGFSLFLPAPLYAAALGTAVASLLTLRRSPSEAIQAAGLLLVALAGIKLDFTYFALLALAGLAVLSDRGLVGAVDAARPAGRLVTVSAPVS